MRYKFAPVHIAWAIVAVLALPVVALIVYGEWQSRRPLRIPMVLTIQDGNDDEVLSQIECYIGRDGDPVWHGNAIAYQNGKRLAHGHFQDGEFLTGGWDVGRKSLAILPAERFDVKRIISCREMGNTLSKVEPGRLKSR